MTSRNTERNSGVTTARKGYSFRYRVSNTLTHSRYLTVLTSQMDDVAEDELSDVISNSDDDVLQLDSDEDMFQVYE